MKIKICVPHYAGISPETMASIEAACSEMGCAWQACQGTTVRECRNTLILGQQFSLVRPPISDEHTHFLILDADIKFEVSHLQQLVDRNLPIVSGSYLARNSTTEYAAGDYDLTDGIRGKRVPSENKGLLNPRWVGMGFCLISADVFKKLNAPWFRDTFVYFSNNGIDHCAQTTEDIGFCLHAEESGFDINLDADCVVEHLPNARFEAPKIASRKAVDDSGNEISVLDIASDTTRKMMNIIRQVSELQHNIDVLTQISGQV